MSRANVLQHRHALHNVLLGLDAQHVSVSHKLSIWAIDSDDLFDVGDCGKVPFCVLLLDYDVCSNHDESVL